MPVLLRTRIVALEPEQIALTVAGCARIEVRGNAYGYLRCGRERRWVWGAFTQTFQVSRMAGTSVVISALGLFGYARRVVRFLGTLDLKPTRPPAALRRPRWSPYLTPRLGPLSAQTIRTGSSEHERN